MYATLEFDDDTLIVEVLNKVFHLSWSWDIWHEDNSILKKKMML